jgi:hypothetical protein
MKLEILLFGRKDWAVRLHILAAFVLCYYYVYQTLKLFTSSATRQTLYLLVIFFNPYLLDFFGLARGYALSMAAYAAAFYYFIRYADTLSLLTLRKVFIALFISVWSNFSALYFLLLFSGLIVWVVFRNRGQIDYKKHLLYVAIAGCAAMIVVFIPLMQTLASKDTFGGKTGIFQDCVVQYINQFIHFDHHISRRETWPSGLKLTEVLAALFLLTWAMMHFISFLFPAEKPLTNVQYYTLVLLAGVAVLAKSLFVWKGVPYPTARTELLFSMPFYMGVCATAERIILQYKKAVLILYVYVALLAYHFGSAVTFENTLEWWQNGDAKRVLRCLQHDLKDEKSDRILVFGVEGWYYHSIAFYTEVAFKNRMQTKWSDLHSVAEYDYVYASFENKDKIPTSFEAVATFKHGVLYKARGKVE